MVGNNSVFTQNRLEIKSLVDLYAKIDAIYGAYQAKNLKSEIKGKAEREEITPEYFNLLKSIVSDHEVAFVKQKNVLKQMQAVKDSKTDFTYSVEERTLHPGRVNLRNLLSEGYSKMGIGEESRYKTYRENFSAPPIGADSIDRRAAIESIKGYGGEVVSTKPLGGRYMSNLFQAQHETMEETKLHAARLLSVIKHGKDLEENEKQKYEIEVSQEKARARNLALGAGSFLQKNLNKLGRGIWSESDVADDKYFKKYTQKRNGALLELMNKFGPNSGAKTQLMQQIASALNNSQETAEGMIDSATFGKLMNLIEEELKKDQKQVEGMSDEINKLNEALLEDARNHSKESDDMWKWRAFQMILLVTPFFGISLLGPVLGAAGGIFSGGFGSGIASIMTAEEFGFLGDLVGYLRIDTAVEWLLTDSPILGDVIGVFDWMMTSEIGGAVLGEMLMPVLASPLVPIVVAGAVTVFRANTEIDHYKKYSNKFKAHDKALQTKIKEYLDSDRSQDSDFSGFVKQKHDILKECFKNEALTNFVELLKEYSDRNGGDLFNQVLGEDFIKYLKDHKLLENGKLQDFQTLSEALSGLENENPEIHKELLSKFYAFRAIDQSFERQERGNIAQIFEIYNAPQEHREGQIQRWFEEGEALTQQDYIFQTAALREIDFDESVIDRNVNQRQNIAQKLQSQILKEEELELKKSVEKMKEEKSRVATLESGLSQKFGSKTPSTGPLEGHSAHPLDGRTPPVISV